MQTVSSAWKDANLETIVPETFVEISYKVLDPEAQIDATATDSGSMSFSDTWIITDERDKSYEKYAVLEVNSWALDGSVQIMPDVITFDTGFVSDNLCNADCTFDTNPVITITFTSKHTETIPGLNITWSAAFDECARKFEVKAYDGASVVASKLVDGNVKNVTFVEVDISGYDKITIEIIEWCLPHCRARIEEVLLGLKKIFGKADLSGFEHEQNVDLLSGELPKSQIVFTLDNVDEAWNPDNPDGELKYLISKQEVSARFGMKLGGSIEWIKCGTFYMSDWQMPSNGILATFTASDLIEFMHMDFTTASSTITLYNLATEAFQLAGLPKTPQGENRWHIDDALKAITITIPGDFKHSCAEVVQLCANAACCVLYQDRLGVIRIVPLANVLSDYVISRGISYANAEYETDLELKSVDVNDGMGSAAGNPNGEVQTMSNPLIQSSGVANNVAEWVRDCLMNRNRLTGDFRPDVRLDALDKVTVENKYATNTMFITRVSYSYNGAFRGSYEGRVMA